MIEGIQNDVVSVKALVTEHKLLLEECMEPDDLEQNIQNVIANIEDLSRNTQKVMMSMRNVMMNTRQIKKKIRHLNQNLQNVRMRLRHLNNEHGHSEYEQHVEKCDDESEDED